MYRYAIEVDKREDETKKQKRASTVIMLRIPPVIAEYLAGVAESIPPNKMLDKAALQADDAHVTLLFLGETSKAQRSNILARVDNIAKQFNPLCVAIRGTKRFPYKDGSILVGTADGTDLTRLHMALKQAFPESPHDMQYVPHVTLAYLKPGENRVSVPYLNQAWVADSLVVSTPEKDHVFTFSGSRKLLQKGKKP